MDALSVGELRQALRERGANSRGSKKQLLQRLSEEYSFQASSAGGAAAAPVAKVRVTLQKSRSLACMLLVDPALSGEHNVQEMLKKAANKFKFKPTHLYVLGSAAHGGGVELTSENVGAHLKDGLVVLASTAAKPANDELTQNATDAASEADARGGAGSGAEMDSEMEIVDRASVKSFDSDSVSSSTATATATATATTTRDGESKPVDDAAHLHALPARRNCWSWMLPQDTHAAAPSANGNKPPTHPTTSNVVTWSKPTPAFIPSAPHRHWQHRCQTLALDDADAPAPLAAAASSSSSSAPDSIRLPSLMFEIGVELGFTVPFCLCCDSGCKVEVEPVVADPPDAARPSALAVPVAPTATVSSAAIAASHSAAAAASATPPPTPHLSHSHSSSTISSDQRRILDLEKANRRLDASLKSYLKSDLELRARVAALTASTTSLPTLEAEFRSLKFGSDMKEKELAKATAEVDRLKAKNRQLTDRNAELKAEGEVFASLQKEHASLQQRFARVTGEGVNATTTPAVLQELLMLHTSALQRVHVQMSTNIARDKKALQEARLCKVCMAKPADTILLPCSHFVLCGHCASSVSRCPICRATADDKRPVYM